MKCCEQFSSLGIGKCLRSLRTFPVGLRGSSCFPRDSASVDGTFPQGAGRAVGVIWGGDSNAEHNNLEVFISFIRKKIRFLGSTVEIRTSRGIGYSLV